MFYVARYLGKCKFIPRNIYTVVTKPETAYDIKSEFVNYQEARQYANRLNTARYIERQDECTLIDSLSNGEPLRPLKNDIMEIKQC